MFNYKAIDSAGATVSGAIDAAAAGSVEEILFAKGLIPVKISEVKESTGFSIKSLNKRHGSVSPVELVMFLKQFRTMFRAGIPLMRLLEIMKTQLDSEALKSVVSSMIPDITSGMTLSDAMAKYPKIFQPLHCAMIKAGEISGNLPEVMDKLIYIISHENKAKAEIKSAMTYPVIVVTALGGAFIFLLTFVIPKFIDIFSKYDIELPLPTRIAIMMHDALVHYWVLFAVIIAAIAIFLFNYFKTEGGKFVRDSFLLAIPVFGPLFVKGSMSRFASMFSILHTSGVPLMESLTILTNTFGNTAISRIFKNLREQIEEGKGIAIPLQTAKYFTPMVVTMIAIGEETGNLDEMLNEISAHYDDEVHYTISRMTEILGPFLIVCLATVVLFFALAIFLPMWDLTKIVHGK
ncbi:MAG: type II secretion system F family protein [Candidatus Magnetominusculus sp. LBB02]|nr:type II secretion system F family protein [Candidatus Magnetominusculus sp. LBB02]